MQTDTTIPQALKDKVLEDALVHHIRNLRAEVEINGFRDREHELAAARQLWREWREKKVI